LLYLLGGAARVGKSTLSRKLLIERHIPYLPIDTLKMGFANGMPTLAVDPNASSLVIGEQLWPVLHAMSVCLLENDLAYLLEGDMLLPKYVDALLRDHGPATVRACFLGYTTVSLDRKLWEIRRYGGGPDDWMRDLTDAEVLDLIAENVQYSRYLQQECALYGIAYFDTAEDYPGILERAYHYLVAT
jgi:hypothetical protein